MTRFVLAALLAALATPVTAQPDVFSDGLYSIRTAGGVSFSGPQRLPSMVFGAGVAMGPIDLTVTRVQFGEDWPGPHSWTRPTHGLGLGLEILAPVSEIAYGGGFVAYQWMPFESRRPDGQFETWRTLHGWTVGAAFGMRIQDDAPGTAALIVRPFLTTSRWEGAWVSPTSDQTQSIQVGVSVDLPSRIRVRGPFDLYVEPSLGYGVGAGLIFGAMGGLILN